MGIACLAQCGRGEQIVAGERVVGSEETGHAVIPASHERCLLCGHKNPWSLGLVFAPAGGGVVEAVVTLHRGLQGYEGILHGGVISSLLDAAMTHCLFHDGIEAVTGDLHVRFVQPVPCEKRVTLRSWILTSFSPLYRLRAELLLDGRLMAWGEGKFARRMEKA